MTKLFCVYISDITIFTVIIITIIIIIIQVPYC